MLLLSQEWTFQISVGCKCSIFKTNQLMLFITAIILVLCVSMLTLWLALYTLNMAEANSYVIGKQVFATKILDNRVKYWPDDGARQSTWVDRQKDIALLLYFLILKFCSFQYHFDTFPAFTVICHQNTFHLYACKVNSEWSWMVPGQSFIKCNNNKRSLIFSSVQGFLFLFFVRLTLKPVQLLWGTCCRTKA